MSINKRSNPVNLTEQISRRQFLYLGGLGFLGMMFPKNFLKRINPYKSARYDGVLLGRVTRPDQSIYAAPDPDSPEIDSLPIDSLVKITGVAMSSSDDSPNRIWYELNGRAYVHARFIQPVRHLENSTNTVIPSDGCLGEVTLPFVDAYQGMDKYSSKVYRLYYASTYWILERNRDSSGQVWYRLLDDRTYGNFFVPAIAIRVVPYSELQPISPDVPWDKKTIEVDLSNQTMTAFEYEKIVYMARISSGIRSREGGFATPKGYYHITRKRPCRHMAYAGDDTYTGYDLPGVPWVSYFTSNGVAFHGTYWHNDFGVPHSHGCVNLTPEAAKWVYLWTTPTVVSSKYVYSDTTGTRIYVF